MGDASKKPHDAANIRERMERAVEMLIAALDCLDGDPDSEPSLGFNPCGSDDREMEEDAEPSLAAPECHPLRSRFDGDLGEIIKRNAEMKRYEEATGELDPCLRRKEPYSVADGSQQSWMRGGSWDLELDDGEFAE